MGVQMDEVEAEATRPLAFKRKASTGSHKKPKLAKQDDIDTAILECIRGKLMSFLLHKHSPQYFSCWHCRPPEGRRYGLCDVHDERIEKNWMKQQRHMRSCTYTTICMDLYTGHHPIHRSNNKLGKPPVGPLFLYSTSVLHTFSLSHTFLWYI